MTKDDDKKLNALSFEKQQSMQALVKFALEEMQKMAKEAHEGKNPTMSPALEKLSTELKTVSAKSKTMNEDEIKQWADTLTSEIEKIDEEE